MRLASYLHGCDFAWYPRVAPATHVGQVHPISSCVDPDCTRSCTPNNIRNPESQKFIFPDCQKYQKSRGIHVFFFDFGNKNLWGHGGSQESGLGRSQGHWPGVLLCKGRIVGVDMGWISVAAYKCVGMNLWMHFCWQFIFWHFLLYQRMIGNVISSFKSGIFWRNGNIYIYIEEMYTPFFLRRLSWCYS